MSGGNGNGHGNGAAKSRRRAASGTTETGSARSKPDDLPPLPSLRDRLPWLPWVLVGVMGAALVALTLNALDFSRREQLLERRLDLATEEGEALEDELDTPDPVATVATTTTSDPSDAGAEASVRQRELELQQAEAELERRSADLDRREASLDEREGALTTTPPTTDDRADGSFGPGVYLVGVEIAPGTYRANAPAGCRYQKLAAAGRVIFADQRTEPGPVSVTIGTEVDRFDSSGCGTWVLIG